MIRTILFDFGGVVVTLSYQEAVKRFMEIGLTDAPEVLNPYKQTSFLGDFESGLIGKEDFRRKLSDAVGRELTMSDCAYCLMGFIEVTPLKNLDKIVELRNRGYRVAVLSNTNPFIMEWANSSDFSLYGKPVGDYFDAMYLSYKLHGMKPDERVFRKVLEGEGLNADEVLFLDDGARNIEVAKNMGFRTLLATDSEKWITQIEDILADDK